MESTVVFVWWHAYVDQYSKFNRCRLVWDTRNEMILQNSFENSLFEASHKEENACFPPFSPSFFVIRLVERPPSALFKTSDSLLKCAHPLQLSGLHHCINSQHMLVFFLLSSVNVCAFSLTGLMNFPNTRTVQDHVFKERRRWPPWSWLWPWEKCFG